MARAAELRRRAEEEARRMPGPAPGNLAAQPPETLLRTLQELQVHRIELELQNEDLRRAQAELETARARYFSLYDRAPVGYCALSGDGIIREANLTAAILLGTERQSLVSRPWRPASSLRTRRPSSPAGAGSWSPGTPSPATCGW
jgi:PAS domain-containing protein